MKKVLNGMVAIAKSRPFVAAAFAGAGFLACMIVHGLLSV